ncbi:hypothetical protein F4778DRAFT_355450 [Xylariomycetidae sp. FL2044]|nr:hypothetical protein F4778DRAFT_355450 [Xylariomycetidae sp. FL2044]
MSGPIYHALFRGTQVANTGHRGLREGLRTTKALLRRHKIPLGIFLIDCAPSLLYAESRDGKALRDMAREIRPKNGFVYRPVVPPCRAPGSGDRPLRLPGDRFMELKKKQAFEDELIKRGLVDWWMQVQGSDAYRYTGFNKSI